MLLARMNFPFSSLGLFRDGMRAFVGGDALGDAAADGRAEENGAWSCSWAAEALSGGVTA